MPQIIDPDTGQVIQLPYGNEPLDAPLPFDSFLPPYAALEEQESPRSSNPVDILRQAIQLVKMYTYLEEDDEDLAAATQVMAKLQAILAKQQKEANIATGVTPQAKFLARKSRYG